MVANLCHGDREAQIQAATELSKLSSRQRQKMAEKGVISPLMSMLHSQDCEAIEAALLALLGLAFGSERNKTRIVKAGVVPVLLELLQCENEVLIELAVAATLVLSSCRGNKLAMASSGAIQVLVEGLNNNINGCRYQTRLDVIATLHSLSTCHQIVPLIVSSGLIYTLLELIHSSEKSSELTEKAVALLENLVSLSETALEETAGTGGAIRILVEAVEEGSLQCKEHAVGILLHICQSCRDKYRVLILREGAMPGLLQLSVDGTWRAQNMARELLMHLRDDCSTSKQSKHKNVEEIMQAIDADEETVTGRTLKLVEEMIAKLRT